jgi:hypothetical protein
MKQIGLFIHYTITKYICLYDVSLQFISYFFGYIINNNYYIENCKSPQNTGVIDFYLFYFYLLSYFVYYFLASWLFGKYYVTFFLNTA